MTSEPCKKRPTRNWSTETDEELQQPDTTSIEVSLLSSINNRLAILKLLHADVKDLKASLEFSQSQIETLVQENEERKGTVTNLSTQVTHLSNENRVMKETILDLQCHCMRDNLIFSGIALSRDSPGDPENAVKEFMQSSLKIPQATANEITFHRLTS